MPNESCLIKRNQNSTGTLNLHHMCVGKRVDKSLNVLSVGRVKNNLKEWYPMMRKYDDWFLIMIMMISVRFNKHCCTVAFKPQNESTIYSLFTKFKLPRDQYLALLSSFGFIDNN